MAATVDLNSDMGESFGAYRIGDDEAMLDLVTSANIAAASGALLVYNFYPEGDFNPATVSVAVNGDPISEPWPYPDSIDGSPRTLAVQVPLADIVPGDNTLTFNNPGNLFNLDVMNVSLVLQGAAGIVDP